MTVEGNSSEHVGVLTLREDPEHLQPFYLMLLTSNLKLVLTVMVFKIDSLKPPEILHKEWRRDDTFSRVKRVGGICMQICFIALALNTFIADVREVASSARDHNLWQVYTCFVVKWNTSTNFVAAFAAAVIVESEQAAVLGGEAKDIDPFPFGQLHKVAFYLKVAYCSGLHWLVYNPAVIGWLSHVIVGAATFVGIAVYELLKFIFFAFWRDIFVCNQKLLAEDAQLLWIFSYPTLFVVVGYLLAFPVVFYLDWWHRERESNVKYRALDGAVETQSEKKEEAVEESSELLAEESVGLSRMGKLFNAAVGATAIPLVFPIGILIAARIYQGEGVYPAIAKTVSERTLQRYVACTWADLSATGASMQYKVDMVLRAIWACL